MARRIGILKRFLFSLVPLILLLVLVETGFRIAGVGRPEVKPPSDAESEEVELTAPDGRVSTYRRRIHLGVPHRRNELGSRDWLFCEDEREGALRIAALGDSYVEGYGVKEEEIFFTRLGDRLRADRSGGPPIRTMNFGRGGLNAADYRKRLEEVVLRFHPRLLVLGFTVFNDAETHAEYKEATVERRKERGQTTFQLAQFVKDHSYFVNWTTETLRRGKRREGMRVHLEAEYADDAPGWIECRKALADIARICAEHEVGLVVAIFPVHQDDIALNDWAHYPHRRVHEKIREVFAPFPEVTVVDVVDGFEPLTGKMIWVEVDRHPNALWHELVAELLEAPVRAALAKLPAKR